MLKPNQLYIANSGAYHVLLLSKSISLYDTLIYLVKTNMPGLMNRPCVMLTEASIKQSLTLVANNYQPK